jgi:hypothetical protein
LIANGEFTPPPDDGDACILNPPMLSPVTKKGSSGARRIAQCQASNCLGSSTGDVKAPGINFLAMTIKHSVHHRGQLSTYLRPMERYRGSWAQRRRQ